jgi:lysophospholipase L1-like esterase
LICGHVTAIGDSVMLDAQPDLVADIPGIDVEAVVSRQWDSGVELAQEMRAEGRLGSIVVIDLGTNGPVYVQQFQQMMQALSGASIVVFVTVHLPPSYSWANSVNQTLEAEVPHYRNARLANFNALADANPAWFGPDGVHMAIGGTGAQAMAFLIASEI